MAHGMVADHMALIDHALDLLRTLFAAVQEHLSNKEAGFDILLRKDIQDCRSIFVGITLIHRQVNDIL